VTVVARASAAKAGQRRSRAQLTETEKIKVWVRAGGVCALCHGYMLEGTLTGAPLSLGELAHIVGQQANAASPRGLDPLPRDKRDRAENVVLACPSCHAQIDKQAVAGILDVARLTQLKAEHEQRIRHLVTLPADRRTLVLRLLAKVRGNPVEVTRDTAAATVTADGRFPWFDLDRDRSGVEVDLRTLPGEQAADEDTSAAVDYYAMARSAIDEALDARLHDAVKDGPVRHISVFAFARLPLLVYLGSKLEDNVGVEVYQRHRQTQTWQWDSDAPSHDITLSQTGLLTSSPEALLVCNVSGTVDPTELSPALQALPRLTIAPTVLPTPDMLRSRACLQAFTAAAREANALLDAHKNVRRLHLVGALPPAAAVELGRLHDPHIHPALVVYSRRDDRSYRPALEIA